MCVCVGTNIGDCGCVCQKCDEHGVCIRTVAYIEVHESKSRIRGAVQPRTQPPKTQLEKGRM